MTRSNVRSIANAHRSSYFGALKQGEKRIINLGGRGKKGSFSQTWTYFYASEKGLEELGSLLSQSCMLRTNCHKHAHLPIRRRKAWKISIIYAKDKRVHISMLNPCLTDS
ncbi:hypothetical protein AAMO2058_000167600 [Amorphochlora amoebiformis]